MKPAYAPFLKVRSYTALILAGWTVVVLWLMWTDLAQQNEFILDIARAEAQTNIEKDLIYRRWNAAHGGVYVPVTEETQPNPYLNAFEREVITPSGRVLTLINPAYMTRQVHEAGEGQYGIRAHLTSLNPINPGNTPDDWEREALQSFEKGAIEASSLEIMDGEEYMRVMLPFFTEEGCLKCHAQQGYKIGDIRGGLSVSIPMSKYAETQRSSLLSHMAEHGFLWLLGASGILFISNDLKKRIAIQDDASRKIQESHRQLLASEARWQFALEGSGDGVWDWNSQTNEVFFSRQWKSMLGYEEHEIGNNLDEWKKRIHPEDREFVFAEINKHFSGETPIYVSEHRLMCKDGSYKWILDRGKIISRAGDGKPLRVIGTHSDISERMRANDALRESEERLRLSTELANVAVWEYSFITNSMARSRNHDQLYGLDWQNKWDINTFLNATHADDRAYSNEIIQKSAAPGGPDQYTFDFRVVFPDQSIHWLLVIGQVVERASEGQAAIVRGALIDITEHKRIEEALTASEIKYRNLVETAQELVWKCDGDGKFTYLNPAWETTHGYKVEEMLGRPFSDFQRPEVFARDVQEFSRHLAGGSVKGYETTHIAKDGRELTLLFNAIPLFDEHGNVIGTQGTATDITKRKRAEEHLRESEASLKFSQQVAHVGHWTWDTQTNTVIWSDEMHRIFGLDPENFNGDLNQVIAKAIHPDDQEKINAANQTVLTEQKHAPMEYRVVWQDGSVHTIWAVPGGRDVDANGNILKLRGTVQDISERKQAEESLRLSEERFRTLVTSSDDVIFTLDTSERHTGVFGRWLEKSNIKPEFFLGRTSAEVLGAEAGKPHHQANLRALRGENVVYEWQAVDGENGITYYQTSISPMYADNGQVIGIVGIGHDITRLKNTEIELRAREAHLKQAQYLSNLGTWEWDPITDKTIWSDEMLNIYGITREEFTGNGQDYINFTHPEDRPIQQSNIRRDFEKAGQLALETGQTVDDVPDPKEFRIVRSDGSICWVQGDAIEYVDEHGNPLRMLGILRDITRRKMDEQFIRQSEEQYRLLFEEMMDGFALHEIVCDENGHPVDYRFLAVNSAFENLTSLQAKDIIGKTVLEVLPATEKFWVERYGKVALGGEPDHFEEFSSALNSYYEVRVFSPSPNKFAVIFHDISQRKHSENITLARMKFVEIATTHSLETLLQTLLDETEALTGSSIGFYHFVEPDQKTLSLQNWSTRTVKEFCRAEGIGMHYPVDKAGVWVECVHEKRPVIHNDYASLPDSRRKGLPEGHAEVIRELVVPVMRGEKVIAIFGVGNKQTEYTHRDVDIVQQLSDLAMEIVERKRAEDAQVKAQQNYESLIQTIDGIVWEADAQTFQFSFVSEQAERLLGYPTQRWLEESDFWKNHIHPEDREETFNFCVEQTQAMRAHEFEYRMIASDERVVWLRDVVSVVVEKNQPAKLRGIMLDITEKKASEEKLQQLSLAVEQNPAAVVITNLNGNIEYVNPKFTQVSGYALEEIIGKNPRILKSGETSQKEYNDLWQTITSGKVWHGELHNRKKNGELYWEDAMISPLTDDTGKITHFVAVKEDITERKRSEKEILGKNADLAALFSISAHLRTAASASDMLPLVLQEMGKALNADANAVILLEADMENFIYALGDGLLASNTGLRFPAENSISGIVMQTREAYVTHDFADDPHRSQGMRNYEDVGPVILVPLQSESEFIGALLSARHKNSLNGEFSFTEIQLLKSIGEMVGNALRRARLYDQALTRLKRVQTLRSIDAAINANMDSTVTLRILINQIMTLMNVDAAAVLLYDPNTHILEYAAAHGFRYKDIENAHLKLGNGLAKIAIIEHRLIKIPDLAHAQDPIYREIAGKEGFVSCYVSPMIAKGQVCGLLEVYSRTALNPNDEWFDFLESLGAQAAIAIDNAQLFINLEKSNLELSLAYDATIAGWSHALDLKDKDTEGHTQRVTAWTIDLAKLGGLGENEIMHIRRGALLHDIGKMGIPDNVLNKAGKLTAEEWDLVRQHPQYAYNMIYPIEFLRPALDIPYCHHEKWDGTGYPRGLQKLQIPYAARLFAVIDVWDALTSDRVYRKAWSHKKTIAFIKSQSGKHFDPKVVELFMVMADDLIKASRKK